MNNDQQSNASDDVPDFAALRPDIYDRFYEATDYEDESDLDNGSD